MKKSPPDWAPPIEIGSRLRDYDREVRTLTDTREVLQLAAETIVAMRLFRRVVISTHDDDGNLGPIGHCGVPRELIEQARRAPRVRREVREAILDPRFMMSESYFVPAESGILLDGEARHIPANGDPYTDAGWKAGDELFTPLRRGDSSVAGFCSVDDPFNGSRPTETALAPLESVVARAAAQIELIELRALLGTTLGRWQRQFSQSGDFHFEFDIATNRYVAASPAGMVFTGLPCSEMTSLSFDEWVRRFVHPEDRERVRSIHLSLVSPSNIHGPVAPENEYRIVHRDGSVRWVADRSIAVVDADGQPIAIEGMIRDVSAVRKLVEERDQAMRRYRLVAENARDIIYAHDKTGHMFYVSPSLERYLGVKTEEFLGSHFSDWLTEDPINQAAFEAFDAEINDGVMVAPFVLELRAKDGRTFLMEFNESVIRDDSGEIVGVQGVGRDITDRERLLHTLKDHQKRLDSANRALRAIVTQARRRQEEGIELNRRLQEKNKELESFVHIVSHDLRAPLITLRGLISQMRRLYAKRIDERGRDLARRLDSEAARLLRLVGDLVEFVRSGADPAARRAVDAGLLIESVWTRLVESGLAENAQLATPPDRVLLWADPVALERVIENLLANAVTHRSPNRPPRVEVAWQRPPGFVELEIHDNGIGIEPEDRPHICELFFRGRNATAEGSGVGLAIVKRIVESSGARITCRPNPDGGSVFVLNWPSKPAGVANP